MPGARNDVKELRNRVDEVEDLRHEEQQQGLAEVTENSNDCKHHASEVAVSVPNENLRWIPVVIPQRKGDACEGQK